MGQPNLRDRLRQPSLRQLAQRVGVHFHLQPLDEEESKEYIQYRLARAGGSGIFTPSALDKLFQVTQGVPRRINAWCDLALVAGFAEGRQEIDQEFLETVVAAQGESLEGPDRAEGGLDEELPPQGSSNLLRSEPAGSQASFGELIEGGSGELADNNLRKEILELSERMARLEGLVLDLVSQLVPAITRFFIQLPPDLLKTTSPSLPPLPVSEAPEPLGEENPLPPKKSGGQDCSPSDLTTNQEKGRRRRKAAPSPASPLRFPPRVTFPIYWPAVQILRPGAFYGVPEKYYKDSMVNTVESSL